MGFWEQSEGVQLDLLAYRRIALDRNLAARYGLLLPKRFDDEITLAVMRNPKKTFHFSNKLIEPSKQGMPSQMFRARMKKAGSTDAGMNWLLSGDDEAPEGAPKE